MSYPYIPPKISPSLLSADFTCLKDEISALEQAGADWIHYDVMDGHFVPNLTFGPCILKALRPLTTLPFDVHLMIAPVFPFLEAVAHAGADYITFHIEASLDPLSDITFIKNLGKKVGLSLRPSTPLESLIPWLEHLDLVLIMTVNPGFGGQSFMEDQLSKAKHLRSLIQEKNLPLHISIDGGITPQTAPLALKNGADVLVAGTSILSHPKESYKNAISALRIA